jgi:hypothetical protein
MQTEKSVFEKTYQNYLEQIRKINFNSVALKLGLKTDGETIKIPFFKSEYTVFSKKITGPSGEKPAYDICVILSKYLLLCPDEPPAGHDWVSFRNLKDAGPLTKYFANEIEHAVVLHFSGKPNKLKKAGPLLGAYPPELDAEYDIAMQFDALPMIPVLMLFNDADEEFPAKCSMLFESRVEKYLDAECIAMLGRQMFSRLKKASERFG